MKKFTHLLVDRSQTKKVFLSLGLIILIALIVFCFSKKDSKILKIGFVTDWEYSQTNNNNKDSTKTFLAKAVSHYNYLTKPDLVISGGDYLEKMTTKNSTQLQEILSIFNKIKAEKLYCLGKNDSQENSLQEIKKVLTLENSYYSKIYKGIKLIILDTTQNNKSENFKGTINKSQTGWLEKELSGAEPVLIFSHHSLIETPVGDLWQQNLTNQEEIFDLIKTNNQKIIAVVSGNSPKDYITKQGGIPFINIGGLTEAFTLGRFSDLKITPDQKNPALFLIDLENHGKNGSAYEIKRELTTKTATRINLKKRDPLVFNQRWFDLSDKNNLNGILNKGSAGETNIGITKKGTIIGAFESKENSGKIQVRAYKNNKWIDLSDENYPEGLISLGKGSNPNIETKDEDIFVIFSETEYDSKIRLLHWSNNQQEWNELSPQGFISEKPGHEPTLIFDKNHQNLYVAFAEQLQTTQNQAHIKKWDGKQWTTVTKSLSIFADLLSSSVDEFDLVASSLNNSIYMSYEEQKINGTHTVKVKKWNGQKWNNLKDDKLNISQINGFSPSIAIDKNENLYLAFVENNKGPLYVYKHNQTSWQNVGTTFKNSTDEVIEPFVEIDHNNNLYLAYSEHKDDIIMTANNGKNTGEELTKASAWRVRVQKLENDNWINCADELNSAGYISKGSGKGDPALKTFENNLYIIFGDEANDYAAHVKKYSLN